MQKVMILDNYDSFTYNLVHLVEKILHARVDVFYNDEVDIEKAKKYDKIILSPGPGLPDEAGDMKKLIAALAPTHPLLGVCLGHQALGEYLGARLKNLPKVYHGCASPLTIKASHAKLFKNIPNGIMVGRYHSWVIDTELLPESFEVTATDHEGNIMAIAHRTLNITGVQFHPESIMTPYGEKLISNWLFD